MSALAATIERLSGEANKADDCDVCQEDVLDRALHAIDSVLCMERFDEVNEALAAVDLGLMNIDVAVLVLLSTKPARDRLPAREVALERFAVSTRARLPDRAERILGYL